MQDAEVTKKVQSDIFFELCNVRLESGILYWTKFMFDTVQCEAGTVRIDFATVQK